jgi:superkiller protein 8
MLMPFLTLMLTWIRSHDSKAKVWRIDTRACVATHSHGDKPLWTAKWLPKNPVKSEMFALAGGSNAISFYREAAGWAE